jgi:hypothetical protein
MYIWCNIYCFKSVLLVYISMTLHAPSWLPSGVVGGLHLLKVPTCSQYSLLSRKTLPANPCKSHTDTWRAAGLGAIRHSGQLRDGIVAPYRVLLLCRLLSLDSARSHRFWPAIFVSECGIPLAHPRRWRFCWWPPPSSPAYLYNQAKNTV